MRGLMARQCRGVSDDATAAVSCAAGPLEEEYAARLDDLFGSLAQRRGFGKYLAGLRAPSDRNKVLKAALGAALRRCSGFSSSCRALGFLSRSTPADRAVAAGPRASRRTAVGLVIDDSGDRKDGVTTAHVGHRWLGPYGKTNNGVITVTTVRADERLYYPVHGVVFRAACADSADGYQDGFRGELADAGLPSVMALMPRRGAWAYGLDAHTPVDTARALVWAGRMIPGDWRPVMRAFRSWRTQT